MEKSDYSINEQFIFIMEFRFLLQRFPITVIFYLLVLLLFLGLVLIFILIGHIYFFGINILVNSRKHILSINTNLVFLYLLF